VLKVSIDTCILLDLFLDQDPESIAKLARHQQNHDELVICGMVYGELFPIL
jgi:predicted nucleic acid-binding protein